VEYVTSTISRLKRSSFIRHNAIFFVGSVAVGALNYLYYPILGRLLSPAAFGEVQALVSFFLQLSIFLTVLGLVTVNIAANYEDEAKRNQVIFELERIAFVASLALLGFSVIFSHQVGAFFQFDDSFPFVILMLTIVVSVPFTFRSAFIRGRRGFVVTSIANLLASSTKILLSATLVAVGLGTAGAIWGVAFAQFLAFLYVAYWAKRIGLLHIPGERWHRPDISLLKPELKYAGLVLVTSLVVTLQFSIDILIVKHFFDAKTAGLYAGIAAVARVIFFVTGSISQVLMPSVRLRGSDIKNRELLTKSFYLLFLVSVPVLAVFVLAPEWIIETLMGSQYTEYASLLPMLSAAIFVVSMVNLVVTYYMALRRYAIALIVLAGAFITYGLMITNHTTLRGVVLSLLLGSLSMILLITGFVAGKYVIKQKREEQV